MGAIIQRTRISNKMPYKKATYQVAEALLMVSKNNTPSKTDADMATTCYISGSHHNLLEFIWLLQGLEVFIRERDYTTSA